MGTNIIEYAPLTQEHLEEVVKTYVDNFWDDVVEFKQWDLKYWEQFFEGGGYGVVGTVDDKIVCCYWAMKTPFIYNNDCIQGQELLWFMMPEYRKGKNFLRFLEQIEGVNRLHFVDFYSLNVKHTGHKLAKSLEKYGYKSEDYTIRRHLNV